MKKSPQLRWLLLLVLCSSCELTLFTQTELERPPLPYLDYEGIGCLRLWADGSLVAVMNRTGFNTFDPDRFAAPRGPDRNAAHQDGHRRGGAVAQSHWAFAL